MNNAACGPLIAMALAPYLRKDLLEAGCDEAGRGCLAGPVSVGVGVD